MSALDRFYNGMSPEDMVLNLLATVAHVSEEEAARALQLVKDDYAHELAEKQRAAGRAKNDPHGPYRTAVQMYDEAADLIDPEVSS